MSINNLEANHVSLYLIAFLSAIHIGLPLYILASYTSAYMSISHVSLLYLYASLIALTASLSVARFQAKYHKHRYYFTVFISAILATLSLSFADSKGEVAIFTVLHLVTTFLVYTSINMLANSLERSTDIGKVRGNFLTAYGIGTLLSPFIASLIININDGSLLFQTSAIILLPVIFLSGKILKSTKTVSTRLVRNDLLGAFMNIWKDRNLRSAYLCNLTLNVFYGAMSMFSLTYIITSGLSASGFLSWVMPLALMPLVLLPFETGALADKKIARKHLLILGLILTGIGTLMFVTLGTKSLVLAATALVISRIGAALIETLSHVHFFKQKKTHTQEMVSIFSSSWVAGVFISSLIAYIYSPNTLFELGLIFTTIAIALFCAIICTITIKEPK